MVGTALALAARDRGKRVLLIEIDTPVSAARFLGASADTGHDETEVLPGLFMTNLDPRTVMDEYVRETARVDLIARKILENPVYDRFLAAAPGLPALMVLGKIMILEDERVGWPRRPRFDLLIVDAPATGHGLSFLKVPLAASNAVPVGPVGHNARRILLAPRRCPLKPPTAAFPPTRKQMPAVERDDGGADHDYGEPARRSDRDRPEQVSRSRRGAVPLPSRRWIC